MTWPIILPAIFGLLSIGLLYVAFNLGHQHSTLKWIFFFVAFLNILGLMLSGQTMLTAIGITRLTGLFNVMIITISSVTFLIMAYFLLHFTRAYLKEFQNKKEQKLVEVDVD